MARGIIYNRSYVSHIHLCVTIVFCDLLRGDLFLSTTRDNFLIPLTRSVNNGAAKRLRNLVRQDRFASNGELSLCSSSLGETNAGDGLAATDPNLHFARDDAVLTIGVDDAQVAIV